MGAHVLWDKALQCHTLLLLLLLLVLRLGA